MASIAEAQLYTLLRSSLTYQATVAYRDSAAGVLTKTVDVIGNSNRKSRVRKSSELGLDEKVERVGRNKHINSQYNFPLQCTMALGGQGAPCSELSFLYFQYVMKFTLPSPSLCTAHTTVSTFMVFLS